MRTFAAFSVAGISGILLFKLLTTLFIPLLGLLMGLVAMTVKLALIAAVVFFVYTMMKKRREEQTA